MSTELIGGYGLVDDGTLILKETYKCKCKNNGSSSNTTDKSTIETLVKEEVKKVLSDSLKEEGDKLTFDGVDIMTDDYVKGGVYKDGTLTLNVSNGTNVEVKDLPTAIDKGEVEQIINK